MKRIMMIAGPNGAGKTTMAVTFLEKHEEIYEDFLNADEIARGLSPMQPESVALEAGKLMLKRFHSCIAENKSFIFESTVSGLAYRRHLIHAKQIGYEICLVFLWLLNHEQAVKRVAQRVRQKGHNIDKDVIIRRYYKGIKNLLDLYLPIVDTALILDNSGQEAGVRKVIAKKDSDLFIVEDREIWEKMHRSVNAKI
jgi:predicted ABC-type ATPase